MAIIINPDKYLTPEDLDTIKSLQKEEAYLQRLSLRDLATPEQRQRLKMVGVKIATIRDRAKRRGSPYASRPYELNISVIK